MTTEEFAGEVTDRVRERLREEYPMMWALRLIGPWPTISRLFTEELVATIRAAEELERRQISEQHRAMAAAMQADLDESAADTPQHLGAIAADVVAQIRTPDTSP